MTDDETRVSATYFYRQWQDVMNRVHYGKERIVITNHGTDWVSIEPIEPADKAAGSRATYQRGDQ